MNKVKFCEPLLHLHTIGLNPLKQDKFAFFRKLFSVLVLSITVVSTMLELILNYTNFDTISRASEIVFPLYQNICKYIVLIIYENKIQDAIRRSNQFWALNKFGNNYATSNHSKHVLVKKLYFRYRIGAVVGTTMYIYSLLLSEQPMILSYGENQGLSSELRLFYQILHTFLIITLLSIVVGFDGLFVYLVIHVLTELKMTSVAFSQSKIAPLWNYKKRFEISIKHHIFALDYVNLLDEIYSMFLLNEVIACLFALCFGLYLLTRDGLPPDYKILSKYLPYVVSYLVQIWVYCFAGDLITTWSLEVSSQLFYEDWLLDNAYKFKTDKILILKRAQTPTRLTLGGFGNLDLRTFTLVVKNALSFFMFVNTITA